MYIINVRNKRIWLKDIQNKDQIIDNLSKTQLIKAIQQELSGLSKHFSEGQLFKISQNLKSIEDADVKYFISLFVKSNSTMGKLRLVTDISEEQLRDILKLIYKMMGDDKNGKI